MNKSPLESQKLLYMQNADKKAFKNLSRKSIVHDTQ